jgi:hypothetical protein
MAHRRGAPIRPPESGQGGGWFSAIGYPLCGHDQNNPTASAETNEGR